MRWCPFGLQSAYGTLNKDYMEMRRQMSMSRSVGSVSPTPTIHDHCGCSTGSLPTLWCSRRRPPRVDHWAIWQVGGWSGVRC